MSADDLTIIDLATENAELRERLGLLEAYRDGLQVAIERIADQNGEIERLRRRVASLVDENRELRGTVAA